MTFPFLFGIMFGDIAHGTILFLFGLALCFYKNDIEKGTGILKMAVPIRYMLTFMGFFAMYCGLCYNDFLSLTLNLFGSCFNTDETCKGG